MLFASIWTTTNATNLKDAIVDKQIEFLTTYKLNNTPEITTDNIIKLEGYILLYNSPTTISITTNGDFEIYIDNIQILKSTNNGSIDIYNKGILPFNDIEGDDALILGKLVAVIDQLFELVQTLKQERSINEWVKFLMQMLEKVLKKKMPL
jgi:hypothetical protein